MSFLDAFQERMRELGWTKYRLGKNANLPNNTVHRMFRGNASRRSLRRAAAALGINLNEVMPDRTESWLYTEREEVSLSQKRLAQMTGISQSYLSGIERGLHTPSPNVVQKLRAAIEAFRQQRGGE